jgi:hypothetical protein
MAEATREALMAVIFEPRRTEYDPAEALLRIFATDGPVFVRCAISKAALVELEDDALAGPHAMAITYRRNRDLIQEIAARKYRLRQFEDGGDVVVRVVDLAPRPPFHRAPATTALWMETGDMGGFDQES